MTGSKNTKASAAGKKQQEKKRAQPGDFERQVEQIRTDIKTVRSNLAEAQKALDMSSEAPQIDFDVDMKPDDNPGFDGGFFQQGPYQG
ncbi:unnamed protein product [Chondrus crispus]|uniref:Uncharacterized protein n=1 Tax=Chondrus crispus TaxID=2769 RepID=R7QKY2_CHOCR|nr:unnamed protein product [Chondrus crispus]CDF38423.1 unnamed protein product [Chondrus crispus]|eukprot:XP_005718316.1 unnamed protein product [Chondrus crispus]